MINDSLWLWGCSRWSGWSQASRQTAGCGNCESGGRKTHEDSLALDWIILDHPGSFILIDSHHIISFQLLTAPMQEPFRPGKCLVKSGTIREHLSAEWLGTGLGPWDPWPCSMTQNLCQFLWSTVVAIVAHDCRLINSCCSYFKILLTSF